MRAILRLAVPLLTAAGIVALAPTAMAQSNGEKQLYEAAKKEGQLTWYSGILNQQICDEVGQAFTQEISRRQRQRDQDDVAGRVPAAAAGPEGRRQVQSDVFTTTDVGHMAYLKGKDLLVQYVPENAKGMSRRCATSIPTAIYHVELGRPRRDRLQHSKVSEADAPKDWPDLTNPKWKDQIAFGSPNYSGMIGVWTVAMAGPTAGTISRSSTSSIR